MSGVLLGMAMVLAASTFWFVLGRMMGDRFRGFFRPLGNFWCEWLRTAVSACAVWALCRAWPPSAGAGADAVIAAILWLWSRRRRDRAPMALGAKSRARLAVLVRSMRQARLPRPVLQPVPEGAR